MAVNVFNNNPNHQAICNINAVANSLHMSYGDYVALYGDKIPEGFENLPYKQKGKKRNGKDRG